MSEPQVEFPNEGNSKAKQIQFVANVSHEGADYGPDYPVQIVTMPEYMARVYIEQGRAVEYVAPPEAPAKGKSGDDAKAGGDAGKGDQAKGEQSKGDEAKDKGKAAPKK